MFVVMKYIEPSLPPPTPTTHSNPSLRTPNVCGIGNSYCIPSLYAAVGSVCFVKENTSFTMSLKLVLLNVVLVVYWCGY
ncbi:unnamed protein product [Ilex paraguariensis]|uniref:Transmembrane protein n=1 Tax=Ilex paraguariensis TaxID=185542 RepID=A0ABC8RS06_9AQUA